MSVVKDGRKYIIMNVKTSTVVDLGHGSAQNGAKVMGWRLNTRSFSDAQKNQIWKASLYRRDEYGEWFILKNLASGTVLDLSGGHSKNGTLVTGWIKGGRNPNQQWLFKRTPQSKTPCYQIINRAVLNNHQAFSCLDLSGGQATNGTKLQIWQASASFNNKNQIWLLIEID